MLVQLCGRDQAVALDGGVGDELGNQLGLLGVALGIEGASPCEARLDGRARGLDGKAMVVANRGTGLAKY